MGKRYNIDVSRDFQKGCDIMMTLEQAIKKKNELMDSITAWTMKWKRFRRCQAYTATYNDRYDIIKSYTTIVGLVDKEEKVMYELGKWSPTTSKQITIIHRTLYGYCDLVRC